MRDVLVGCQIALALTLSIQVAVVAHSTVAEARTEKGFDTNGLLTLRIDLPASAYSDPRRAHGFFDALLARVERLPSVVSAGAITRLPIADREVPVRFVVEGSGPALAAEQPWAALASVSAGYRGAMRIPLIKGRDFPPEVDRDAPPVVSISRVMADRYWPGEDQRRCAGCSCRKD